MKMRFFVIAALAIALLSCTCPQLSGQTNTTPAQAVASGDPWPWPSIPGCLSDPGTATSGKPDYASPICAVYDLLLASGEVNLQFESARQLNGKMDGVLYPAFLPGTEVVSFVVTASFSQSFKGPNGLVRVSGSAVGATKGSWWSTLVTVSDSTGHLLNAADIRSKLALLSTPSCLAYADNVSPGVLAYMGVVAPAFDEPGGAVEFWFPPDAVAATKVVDVPGTKGCGK